MTLNCLMLPPSLFRAFPALRCTIYFPSNKSHKNETSIFFLILHFLGKLISILHIPGEINFPNKTRAFSSHNTTANADCDTNCHKVVLTTFLNNVKIICTVRPVRKSNHKKRMTAFLSAQGLNYQMCWEIQF